MKTVFRTILILPIFISYIFANTTQVFKNIENDLDSIVVKDLNNKELIFQKDKNKKIRPASLTKIMTTIIAIESGMMNSVVTITPEMIKVEPTILGLKTGEKVLLRDLVNSALINSANDAANAIAIFLSKGNKKRFVHVMNSKAKRLGMKNTNFENPCGFDAPNHKTTASDLLKLAEYAINNRTFNLIVKKESYSFKTLNTKKEYIAKTSNKLLAKEKYMIGIKTGYTSKAGPCLIARAKDGNKDILLVMLNSNNRWKNTKLALDSVLEKK